MSERELDELSVSEAELRDTLQIDEDELEFNTKGTIIAQQASTDAHAHYTLERLPRLSVASELPPPEQSMAELDLREVLGEGGMGVVYKAVQLPLHREVAVKSIHKDRQRPAAMMALLREAWVTGALQHPNIVPVHLLGCLPDNSPMFVMKRISGVTWDELMHDPEHPLRKDSEKDHLEWNLEVLMQVCNAVHFAHSRGILHRDLKPENVMLGAFGEVYLLDWGIAVSTREKESLPIPLASDCKEVVGTPAYMAPEMATCQSQFLTERTDVYLLGAILHEILTEEPRHTAHELMEALYQAALSAPYEYDPQIPEALVEICAKATHRQPRDRYPSVDALRKALAHFLQCRTSIELSHEASQTLSTLQRWIAGEEQMSRPLQAERRVTIYGLYHECKLGFEQAERIWDGNRDAIEGLQQTHLAMTRYELGLGDYTSAMIHYVSIAQPPEELQAEIQRLAALEREREADLSRLQKLERDVDTNVGKRTRSFLTLALAALLLPYTLAFGRWLRWLEYNYTYHFLSGVLISGLAVAGGVWARDTMTRTAVNRRVVLSFGALCATILLQDLSVWILGIDPVRGFGQLFVLFALYVGALAAFIEIKLMASALVFGLTYLLLSLFPSWTFELGALGNCVGMLVVAFVWRPENIRMTDEERAALQGEDKG